MRQAIALLVVFICLGRAEAVPSRATNRGLGYFQTLIDEGHLSETAIRRMLSSHRKIGRLSVPFERPSGPTELVRSHTAARQLAAVDHGELATLLEDKLRTRTEKTEQRIELRERVRHVHLDMSFIRLLPERPIQLWDPDSRTHVPFQLARPLDVLDTLVTRKQWVARMRADPSPYGLYLEHNERYPITSILEAERGPHGPEHFAQIDAFLAQLDAENPAYHHRLPTPLEWMYFATDRGRDPDRLLLKDDEALLRHAWLIPNTQPPWLHRPVATRTPFLLAGEKIHDVVGLMAELVRPNDRTFAMGSFYSEQVALEPGDHPLTARVTGRQHHNGVYGIRPVREEVR